MLFTSEGNVVGVGHAGPGGCRHVKGCMASGLYRSALARCTVC